MHGGLVGWTSQSAPSEWEQSRRRLRAAPPCTQSQPRHRPCSSNSTVSRSRSAARAASSSDSSYTRSVPSAAACATIGGSSPATSTSRCSLSWLWSSASPGTPAPRQGGGWLHRRANTPGLGTAHSSCTRSSPPGLGAAGGARPSPSSSTSTSALPRSSGSLQLKRCSWPSRMPSSSFTPPPAATRAVVRVDGCAATCCARQQGRCTMQCRCGRRGGADDPRRDRTRSNPRGVAAWPRAPAAQPSPAQPAASATVLHSRRQGHGRLYGPIIGQPGLAGAHMCVGPGVPSRSACAGRVVWRGRAGRWPGCTTRTMAHARTHACTTQRKTVHVQHATACRQPPQRQAARTKHVVAVHGIGLARSAARWRR
eukprot:scaffold1273_cov401-Prasinococcus_capsulatus_cf.AAC.4